MLEDGKKVAVGIGVAAVIGGIILATRAKAAPPPPPPPGLSNLYGSVIDAVSGEALPGALVTLNSDQVLTDQNGFYAFADLLPDVYTVQFIKEGYEEVIGMATLSEGENTLNVGLIPIVIPAMLSGIVTDTEVGNPLGGVRVTVNGMVKYTNTLGEYLFVDLEPGDYTITFEKEGYEVLVR